MQIVKLRSDSWKVAEAIIITVGETARINLVEDSVLPPCVAFIVKGVLSRGETSEHNQE
jgi:hypothetical protein